MSNTSSTRILSIYKSRNTMLEILKQLNYGVDDYSGFSINEIDAMFANSQLDMLVSRPEPMSGQTKIYIKYYISTKPGSKQIRPQNLDEIVEDLFTIDNVLNKNDTLIIIIDDEPNDTILNKMKYLYDHDGIFVVIHNIQRLQFNILKHSLVPQTTVLEEKEKSELMKTYYIKDNASLPEISRFDPVAMAICMRPGQVCKIVRSSATALYYSYYRICV